MSATLQDAMGKIAWFGFNVKLLGVFFFVPLWLSFEYIEMQLAYFGAMLVC